MYLQRIDNTKYMNMICTLYSQGCQAGSMRHRLSALQAAATSWPTLLSVPSKALRLVSRPVMAVTALPTVLMIASPSFCSTCEWTKLNK